MSMYSVIGASTFRLVDMGTPRGGGSRAIPDVDYRYVDAYRARTGAHQRDGRAAIVTALINVVQRNCSESARRMMRLASPDG
jgi:hypothetical protein